MSTETQQQQFASFDPADHTQGGFMDDVDATIVDAEVVTFDFKGKAAPRTCLAITYRQDGAEADGSEDRTEYYSVGDPAKFAPSVDKQHVVSVGGAAINKGAKASLWMAALKSAGFNMAELRRGVRAALAGLRVHLAVQKLPAFTTKEGTVKDDATIIVVMKILEGRGAVSGAAAPAAAPAKAPKTAKGPKTAAAAAAAPAPATAAPASAGEGSDAAADRAVGIILGKLAEGPVAKSALPSLMFQGITDDAALRNAAVKLVAQEAWLAADERPWSYDQGELSLG